MNPTFEAPLRLVAGKETPAIFVKMALFGLKMRSYLLACLLSLVCSNVEATPTTASSTEVPASRTYFYIGGNYVTTSTGTLFENQMYVEELLPLKPSQPYPLVFIHGQAQTGTVR